MKRACASLAFASLFFAAPAGADEAFDAALARSVEAYANLNDYTATFEKREIDKEGKLDEPESIAFKFEKPFKLFMAWTTSRKKGLQLVYERGQHDNKLAIHQPGLAFGLVPVVFLPQDSPWVREGSASFNIEDAGIGTFTTDFAAAVEAARAEGKLEVRAADAPAGRKGFDVTFPGEKKKSPYFAKRVVVHFDEATGLAVFEQLYGWDGNVIGAYEYKDVKLDVGPDPGPVFKKIANKHLLRVYSRQADAAPKKRKSPQNFA